MKKFTSKYLSVVLVGRNDNYGGDFQSRLQTCMSWTHHHLTINEIDAEIIFVNYNPLQEPAIENFIKWPKSNKWVDTKIVTVPNQEHEKFIKYKKIKNVPVLEYLAKNIGIRRSQGEFILCMNPDVLLDERNFHLLKNLSENSYYRADRFDFIIKENVNLSDSLFKKLAKNTTALWLKGSVYYCNGITENQYKKLKFKRFFGNLWKAHNIKLRWVLDVLKINSYSHNSGFKFHCNASGDFMLMHRNNWQNLKGYKEESFIALHVDSLMVVQAAMLGLKETVLVYPVFHKEHKRRYDAAKNENEYREIYLDFDSQVKKMLSKGKAIIYNTDDWGISKINLPLLNIK